MGYSIQILNNIRANASSDYTTRIPDATRENLTSIGQTFYTYEALYNEFLTNLFCKIGKTIIESKLYKNKLSRFKSGALVTAQDVEEIFIGMAKQATAYDAQGKNPLGRRDYTPVNVAYHRRNRQDCYEISIGDIDIIQVFRSEATLDAFILGQINSVFNRAEHDEYILMKNVLATYPDKDGVAGQGYFDYEVPALTATNTETAAKTFVKTLRKAVNDVSFVSDKYNAAGVETKTDPADLVLFINKDVVAEVDVEVLAKAFNLGKTDINVDIVVLDDFGSMGDTYGLLVDKDFFRVWDTLNKMETQRNAQGLFTNYFYHVHQILSASPYKTAVRFKAVTATA